MKKKIYLVGYKSFLQKNLYIFLRKKIPNVQKVTFSNLKKKNICNCIIINCSNDKNFYLKKYNKNIDRNLIISNLIHNKNSILYLISTRQVYSPRLAISEKSKVNPTNFYSRNTLISEKKCKKILNNKLIIMRTSNVIGFEFRKKRKSMMSMLIEGIVNKKVILDQNHKYKKDILPVNFFCKVVLELIKKRFTGLINVGSGISMTLLEIYNYLKLNSDINLILIKNNKIKDNSFSYDISLLKKITKIKITKKNVINELKKIKNEIKKKI